MKILKLLTIGLFVAANFQAKATQEVVQGSWNDRDYYFVLNDVWEDVQGSWGNLYYNLAWDSVTRELSGRLGGEKAELEIDTLQNKIRATAYCGWVDLDFTLKPGITLKGSLCRRSILKRFKSQAELKTWIVTDVLHEIIVEFPEPARATVSAFFERLIQF